MGYRGGGIPEDNARLSWSESAGDPRGDFPIEDHRTAVNTLIGKGLLTIITLSDVEREMSRRASLSIPELLEFDGVDPGGLDFTARGYALFREVLSELHGNDLIQHKDSGWNDDGILNRCEVLAPTRELCQMRVNEDLNNLTSDAPRSIILSVSEPEAIGNWRPNRFVLLSSGYRAVIRYFSLENESD